MKSNLIFSTILIFCLLLSKTSFAYNLSIDSVQLPPIYNLAISKYRDISKITDELKNSSVKKEYFELKKVEKRILVIDDTLAEREMTRRILEKKGYRVFEAQSLKEVEQIVSEKKEMFFDAFVIDWILDDETYGSDML